MNELAHRSDCTRYSHHLLKQLALLLVPPRRINDNDVEPLLAELFDTEGSDGNGVSLGVGAVEGNFGFRGIPIKSAPRYSK